MGSRTTGSSRASRRRTSSSTGRCSPTWRSATRRSSARSPSRRRLLWRNSPARRDLPSPGRVLRRPLTALCSALPRLAGDERVDRVAPDLRWDLPLRLLGALHYLVLAGLASWGDVDAALEEHAGFLGRHLVEQQVQTNEVQRSWALLPAFLSVADGRPLDLLELGP